MTTPWLTDAELVDATHRRQPHAQARALSRMGVPYRKRPDGTLLVGRDALIAAISTTATPRTAANGLNWSKTA